jgi:hypothetical protein
MRVRCLSTLSPRGRASNSETNAAAAARKPSSFPFASACYLLPRFPSLSFTPAPHNAGEGATPTGFILVFRFPRAGGLDSEFAHASTDDHPIRMMRGKGHVFTGKESHVVTTVLDLRVLGEWLLHFTTTTTTEVYCTVRRCHTTDRNVLRVATLLRGLLLRCAKRRENGNRGGDLHLTQRGVTVVCTTRQGAGRELGILRAWVLPVGGGHDFFFGFCDCRDCVEVYLKTQVVR